VSSPAADPASTTTAGATLATPPAALPVALLPVLPVASDGIAARCDVVPVRAGPPPFLLSLQLRR